MEQRTVSARWEARAQDASAGGPSRITGYASVFNSPATIAGLWVETVAPGAFKRTLQLGDIRALWNHNADIVLGRNRAGTLRLVEDKRGLRIEVDLPDTQAGRDAVTSIKRGDVSGMSIAFQIVKEDWELPADKTLLPRRTIREMKLFEVSPVTFPAFEQTSVEAQEKS
jgi:uncharacterized protein